MQGINQKGLYRNSSYAINSFYDLWSKRSDYLSAAQTFSEGPLEMCFGEISLENIMKYGVTTAKYVQ